MALWRPTRFFRTNTQERCPFHYRGLEIDYLGSNSGSATLEPYEHKCYLNSLCFSFAFYKMQAVRPSCRLLRWPQILLLPPPLPLHRCGIYFSIPWVWVGSVTFFGQCTNGKCDITPNVTDACRALAEAEHLMEWHLSADAVSPGAARRTEPSPNCWLQFIYFLTMSTSFLDSFHCSL